jgi:hypothetical protein
MKYIQRIGLLFLVAVFFAGLITVSASAQTRARVSVSAGTRPVVRRVYIRNPFWYNGFYGHSRWGWYDPFWNDPYYTNPRLRELADRVHNENEVKKSAKKLREYQEKFNADGYLTEKEAKKLEKARREYNKDLQRLQDGD